MGLQKYKNSGFRHEPISVSSPLGHRDWAQKPKESIRLSDSQDFESIRDICSSLYPWCENIKSGQLQAFYYRERRPWSCVEATFIEPKDEVEGRQHKEKLDPQWHHLNHYINPDWSQTSRLFSYQIQRVLFIVYANWNWVFCHLHHRAS